jgi:tripartite-type tricarboxylate transporter receptor subunit TctC
MKESAMDRRGVLRASAYALASACAAGVAMQSFASDYPTRPIRVLLGFSPGGPTDVLLRAVVKDASTILAQPIVIENRAGAGAVLPAIQMATTVPDGYTLAVMVSGVFRTDLFKGDPATDLSYIIGLGGYVFGTVVATDSPFRSMADLVAYAKAHPGAMSYSTAGPNTIMEQLARIAGVEFNHIPYKGTAESLQAVLSGQVMACADTSSWAPHVDSGRLRLLSVWGNQRMARFPNVPTLIESGFNVSDSSPWGLVAPKGTDLAIVARLHDAFKQAMSMPAFREGLQRLDMESAYMDPNGYQKWAVSRQALEHERAKSLR